MSAPGFLSRLENLDRRYIYLFVAFSIALPLLIPIGLPVTPSQQAKDFHQSIENIADGSTVILAVDYDPSGIPELKPMNYAVVRHLFSKRADGSERGLKVIAFSLWPAGPPQVRDVLDTIADKQFHKTYGEDYVNLGFKEGREIVMANMGTDIPQVWPKDDRGTPISEIPIMRGIRNYDDIDMLISVGAGYPGLKEWVQQVQSIYKLKMVGGTTGVSAPEYYPYYQSKQLLGMLEGLKGAAEYEKLLGYKGTATKGMDAQSTGHWTISFFIILGNVIYFLNKRKS